MYALNIANDGRVLSVTYAQFAAPDQPIVDSLPDGDITDYLFIDGEYVYNPLPKPEPPGSIPSADDVLNALLGVMV